MPQITIRDIPGQIQQAYAQGWTLQNVGSENVYIDNNPGVSPSTGYVVQPGVGLPISAGAEIWAVADTGKVSTVAIAQGVSAPTVTNLTIDAGTVTAEIDGPVSISGGVIDLGSPVVVDNTPVPLINLTTPTIAPNGQVSAFLNLDVSDYDSIFVSITPNPIVSAFPDVSALADVTMSWKQTAGSLTPITIDEWFGSPYAQTRTVLNVKAPVLTMMISNLSTGGVKYDVVVLGYRAPQEEWYFNHWLSDTLTQGFTSVTSELRSSVLYQMVGTITRTAAGIGQAFTVFDSYSGIAQLPFVRINPTAGAPPMSINVSSGTAGQIVLFTRAAAVLTDTNDTPIYLPRMPIYMRFTSGFTVNPSTGVVSFAIVFEGVNKEH